MQEAGANGAAIPGDRLKKAEPERRVAETQTNYRDAGAEADGIGLMLPPDVPDGEVEGEVDGEVDGAGVTVDPEEFGLGPQAASANTADRTRDSEAMVLRGANDMENSFKA